MPHIARNPPEIITGGYPNYIYLLSLKHRNALEAVAELVFNAEGAMGTAGNTAKRVMGDMAFDSQLAGDIQVESAQ